MTTKTVFDPTPEELTANTLAIFLDETGDESYSDPNHPVFGIGGCAITTDEYVPRVKAPWNRLKRDKLELPDLAFHAVDFDHSGPSLDKIMAINSFLARSFYRLAALSDIRTLRGENIDAHQAVSTVICEYIRRIAAVHSASRCMVFFEHSERTETLLERDMPLADLNARNMFGRPIEMAGFLLPKSCREAGLEIADLIVHTAGKQQRKHFMTFSGGTPRFTPDFKALFHCVNSRLVHYKSITSIENENEGSLMVGHWPHR